MDEQNNVTTTAEESKTFTQDEVNAIVVKRLAQEKAKYEDYEAIKAKAAEFDKLEEANKSELQKASERVASLEAQLETMKKSEEIRTIRDKVSQETGVPVGLLTGETEEACNEQASAIKAYATPTYPTVRDAGEVHGAAKVDTRTQFAQWAAQAFN